MRPRMIVSFTPEQRRALRDKEFRRLMRPKFLSLEVRPEFAVNVVIVAAWAAVLILCL